MAKIVIVKFPPPAAKYGLGSIIAHNCEDLQAKLVWSLPKGTTISICDEATIPCAVISSAQAKG